MVYLSRRERHDVLGVLSVIVMGFGAVGDNSLTLGI